MRCYFARTISFVDDFFKTYLDRQNRSSSNKDSSSLRGNFIRNFFGGRRYIGMESAFKVGYILRLTSIAAIVRFGRNINLCLHVHVAGYRLGFAG